MSIFGQICTKITKFTPDLGYKSTSGCTTRPALRGDGEDAEGAAGAVDDFEGGGDDHGAGGGQLIEVAKAGEAKLSASVHDVMRSEERRVRKEWRSGRRREH